VRSHLDFVSGPLRAVSQHGDTRANGM
jgi:hypothetical protein